MSVQGIMHCSATLSVGRRDLPMRLSNLDTIFGYAPVFSFSRMHINCPNLLVTCTHIHSYPKEYPPSTLIYRQLALFTCTACSVRKLPLPIGILHLDERDCARCVLQQQCLTMETMRVQQRARQHRQGRPQQQPSPSIVRPSQAQEPASSQPSQVVL